MFHPRAEDSGMYLTQYWDTAILPREVQDLVDLGIRQNPTLRHRLFSRDSADDFIAANLSARELAAFRACAVPAMQADYFRYCAVLVDGGFYLDADSMCHQPIAPLLGDSDDGVLFKRANENVVNGVFAFRQAGHPFLKTSLEIATVGIERRIAQSVWTVTGPAIFTFLKMLAVMPAEDRGDLDYDFISPETTASVRLCFEIALARHGSIDRLFDGIRVAPFDSLEPFLGEPDLAYKHGDRHWTLWPGSIYA